MKAPVCVTCCKGKVSGVTPRTEPGVTCGQQKPGGLTGAAVREAQSALDLWKVKAGLYIPGYTRLVAKPESQSV